MVLFSETKMKQTALIDNSLLLIYLATSLIIALISVQDNFLAKFLVRENGSVQTFTVIAYFMAFSTAVILQLQKRISFGIGAAVIFLAMGLRELDFHDRFTTMGIMKSRFYISDTVPLQEKLIVILIVLILIWFIGRFLTKQFHPFRAALKKRDKAALLVLNGIIFTIISKIFDSIPLLFIKIVEESMELAIPCFFLAALLLSVKLKEKKETVFTH